MRIELPGNDWAELRDPATLTERQRRPVRAAVMAMSTGAMAASIDAAEATTADQAIAVAQAVTPADLAVMVEVNDLVAVAMIEAWSFGEPPTSADALLDLPGGTYDLLVAAVAEHMPAFMGVDTTPTKPGEMSPTEPSSI